MKTRPFDPQRLDLPGFCRAGATLAGEWPQTGFARLLEGQSTPADRSPVPVQWSARGELRRVLGAEPELWLHLEAQTVVSLQCQRCLQPLAEPLSLQRRLRFVADEDEALRLDEESEDDVLALPRRLDLHELFEDELILALPLVPRHERCPQPLPRTDVLTVPAGVASPAEVAEGAAGRPNPFAALAALRGGARPEGDGREAGPGEPVPPAGAVRRRH